MELKDIKTEMEFIKELQTTLLGESDYLFSILYSESETRHLYKIRHNANS